MVREDEGRFPIPKYDWVTTLPREEIIRLKMYYEADMTRINNQLSEAKSTAAVEGVFADHIWFRKAKSAAQARWAAIRVFDAGLAAIRAKNQAESKAKDAAREGKPLHRYLLVAMDSLLGADLAASVLELAVALRDKEV